MGTRYHPLLRCESLVLYRIMYENRVMEVHRRNNFVVGSDNTEIISWGHGVCWGRGGIKLNNLLQGRNCFCFALESLTVMLRLSRSLRVSATQETDKPEIQPVREPESLHSCFLSCVRVRQA